MKDREDKNKAAKNTKGPKDSKTKKRNSNEPLYPREKDDMGSDKKGEKENQTTKASEDVDI